MKFYKLFTLVLSLLFLFGCTEKETQVGVSSVSLNTTTIEMVEGDTFSLVATVLPKDAEYDGVIWASSNASVASVNSGTVTAIKEGTATITASAGGKSATCTVKVSTKVVAVTSITLDKTSLSLKVGETETITATVSPYNATDKTITWSSSDVSVATVADGKVTAKKSGTATITAKSGIYTADCIVNISVDTESVTLDKTSLELAVGETAQLTAMVKPDDATGKTVVWTSSDESVAKVVNGKVTALKSGTSTITAKCGSKSAECMLTVIVPVSSVALDKNELMLPVGDAATLVATVKPDNATSKNVKWSSSNESVATVNNGNVVAVKEGETIISASVGNVSASCKVVVINTNRVIKYTAESLVTPFNQDAFGAKIISNEYFYPNGIIVFDAPVTEIGRNAFYKCQTLNTIVIPENVSVIGDNAFYSCGKLRSINLPEGVVSIGSSAFCYCSSLSGIVLPNSVTTIGASAFRYCSSLSGIVLPNSVTTIGASAFSYCSRLSNVVFSKNLETIQMEAFSFTSIKTLDLPHSLQLIGARAFMRCQNITNLIIPEGVVLDIYAFYGCDSLVSVEIQEGVYGVSLGCFQGCLVLSNVWLPSSIRQIDDSAFGGALSNLYLKASVPPEIREFFVGWSTSINIWVPRASVDAYKKKWTRFKDNIKAYDF